MRRRPLGKKCCCRRRCLSYPLELGEVCGRRHGERVQEQELLHPARLFERFDVFRPRQEHLVPKERMTELHRYERKKKRYW